MNGSEPVATSMYLGEVVVGEAEGGGPGPGLAGP